MVRNLSSQNPYAEALLQCLYLPTGPPKGSKKLAVLKQYDLSLWYVKGSYLPANEGETHPVRPESLTLSFQTIKKYMSLFLKLCTSHPRK